MLKRAFRTPGNRIRPHEPHSEPDVCVVYRLLVSNGVPVWRHGIDCFREKTPWVRREATLTGFAPDVDMSQELNVVMLSNLVAKAATCDVSGLPEFGKTDSGDQRATTVNHRRAP